MKNITVRVAKIESCEDENGAFGKRVEIVKDLSAEINIPFVGSEEAKMIGDVMLQLQKAMPMLKRQALTMPKLTLYLTEEEYDSLNIILEVNHTYTLSFEDGKIRFSQENP